MTTPITVEMTEHEAEVLTRYIAALRIGDMHSKPDAVAIDSIHRDLKRELDKYREDK